MDHVIDAMPDLLDAGQVREPQRTVIVVQLEGRNPSRIGLETQHQDVDHQPHVFGDVLRDAVARSRYAGLLQCRPPALQLASFARIGQALLDLADTFQIFVQFLAIGATDPATQVLGIGQHRVQDTLVLGRRFVLEQTVKRQGWVQLQGCRRGRRAPGDMRAVEHAVILVHRRIRCFASQHQAGDFRAATVGLGQQLIEAGAAADGPATGDRCPRQDIAGLGTVNIAFAGLGMVQAADKQQLLAEVRQGGQDLP